MRPSAAPTEPDVNGHAAPPVRAQEELSLLDGLLVLARHKGLIFVVAALCTAFGVLKALTTPRQYTSHAVLVSQTEEDKSGDRGLAALRGMGLNFGVFAGGVTSIIYPDILESQEVRAALIKERFRLSSGQEVVLQDYLLGAPSLWGRITGAIREAIFGPPQQPAPPPVPGDSLLRVYSYNEQMAMNALAASVDVESGVDNSLLTVTVTARDPLLAATLVKRLTEHLHERVTVLLDDAARQRYEFFHAKVAEAEAQVRGARRALAAFEDANFGMQSARLVAERDRLAQEVQLAAEIYAQAEAQAEQARLALQQVDPAITVLDPPAVPVQASAPRRKQIVVVWGLGGLTLGAILAFLVNALRTESAAAGGASRMAQLRAALWPRWLRRPKAPAPRPVERTPVEVAETPL
ncbi:MAG TPA: Wzz/FepE/Etk N-terminal domain-containing protein [Rubricoccaceae bacterium]|nr:Wzz/FepE/Etk N-terminal domain-containing protein [Rubricoccaceae bacterium]